MFSTSLAKGGLMLTLIVAYLRASVGAEFLDRLDPVWFTRVNPVTMRMFHQGLCVGGQLCGEYFLARKRFGLAGELEKKLGFVESWSLLGWVDYSKLNWAWKRQIYRRRQIAESPTLL